MNKVFKVGDFVKFDNPHGSTGKVTGVRTDGPFADKPLYYVEWAFGRDVRGGRMTGKSSVYSEQLVPISAEDYDRIDSRKGWAEDQKPDALTAAIDDARTEVTAAMKNWPAFNSAHEGYGVLAEEVDELWTHIKTNQKRRDIQAMRKEAIQVAAMALRFAAEVCNETVGRK